jgi:drug/metabolite transporter, DME family
MPAAPSRNGAFSGTLLVALAAAGWGTWTLFLRDSGLPPAWQSVMILLVIAGASLPSALRSGRGQRRPRKIWLLVALSGAFDAANYVFFFTAVDRGPIPVAVLTHYLAPVIVALLAPRLLREPLGRRTPPALFCSLCGLALLLAGSAGVDGRALFAALAGGASAIFYGANTLLSKRLLEDVSSAELLSYHSLVAALLLLPLAGALPPLRLFFFRPLAGALLVGWGGGCLFLLGLRLIPAQRGAVLTYFEPLVASAVGAAVFDEAPGPLGLLGGLLILAGGLAVALQPPAARDAAQAPGS